MIKRFINDIKKYWKYISYSARCQLKAEVVESYLGWIWLLLEPICFMLIYSFVSIIVFKSRQEYYPVFIFIGLNIWTLFSKTLTTSTRLVSSNRDTVTKVYIPKFIILISKMYVNFVKLAISSALVVVGILIYKIPITYTVIYLIPLCIVLGIVTFGISTIMLHFGVFMQDLQNIISILLRLFFYASGIFFVIETRVPAPYNDIMIAANPIALIISDVRQVLLYQSSPRWILLGIWFVLGLIISYIGVKVIYKYENTYVKVMR